MPDSSDVVLVTEVPEYTVVDGHLQFTLTSGKRQRVYRISRHKARCALQLCQRVLEDDAGAPSNVRAFKR